MKECQIRERRLLSLKVRGPTNRRSMNLPGGFGKTSATTDISPAGSFAAAGWSRLQYQQCNRWPASWPSAFGGIPWKATAGLHHPLRHFDDKLQTSMHGFVNVFGARSWLMPRRSGPGRSKKCSPTRTAAILSLMKSASPGKVIRPRPRRFARPGVWSPPSAAAASMSRAMICADSAGSELGIRHWALGIGHWYECLMPNAECQMYAEFPC